MSLPYSSGTREGDRERLAHGNISRRAWTIVELLVCISVIAILVGLVLGSLAKVRQSARQMQSLANLRGIGQVFGVYSAANRDLMPFGEAGRLYPVSIYDESVFASFGHFSFEETWPVLVRDVAPWPEFFPVWESPGQTRPIPVVPCAYRYSTSFLARPELWSGTATADPQFLKPVGTHEVLFPTSKVVVWDAELAFLRQKRPLSAHLYHVPTPMGFADSSASLRLPSRAAVGVRNPFLPIAAGDERLSNTPWGVRGRDY